jgi:BioD-like phosphotransacetylase family protein
MSMTLAEIASQLSLLVRSGEQVLDQEVTGGYASDLLSCVMAGAAKGNVWVTLQSHPNVIAVAVLLELAGVIITEGVEPDATTLEKAMSENVPVLTTSDDTYTTVCKLASLGVQGN